MKYKSIALKNLTYYDNLFVIKHKCQPNVYSWCELPNNTTGLFSKTKIQILMLFLTHQKIQPLLNTFQINGVVKER
jgi:hypothetical protein